MSLKNDEDFFVKTDRKFVPQGKRVVCIQGMPGIAMAGKYTVDYLVKNLNAEKIFDLVFFDFPPQVTVNDGVMRLPTVSIYAYFNENNGTDILFLTGNYQPLSHTGVNRLSALISSYLKEMHVDFLISLGASAVNVPVEDPSVFISSTSEPILKEMQSDYNLVPFNNGVITGMNGVLPVILKNMFKIESVILLSQACRFLEYDFYSSKKLISILGKYLNVNVDYSEINKKISEITDQVKAIKHADEVIKESSKEKDETSYIG